MTVVPLFGGIPGGPELLVLLLMMLFMVLPLGIAVWVTVDARDRTDHPLAWGVAAFVAGFSPFFVGTVAVAVLYLLVRDELGSTAPPTFSESDMAEGAQVLGQPVGESEGRATGTDRGEDETSPSGDHGPDETGETAEIEETAGTEPATEPEPTEESEPNGTADAAGADDGRDGSRDG